jgi:hypothetical protein
VRKQTALTLGVVGPKIEEKSNGKVRSALMPYFTDNDIGDSAIWAFRQLDENNPITIDENILFNPTIVMKLPHDLKQQFFYDNHGNMLGVVDKPILLLDIKNINALKDGDKIKELWGKPMHIIFENTKIFWDWKGLGVSMDSLQFLRIILANGNLPDKINNLLDLGCGGGFMGIALFIEGVKIQHIHFADINSQAMTYTQANCKLNDIPDERTTFSIGKDYSGVPQLKYDIAISSPPYIPKKEVFQTDEKTKFPDIDSFSWNYVDWLDDGLLKNAILEGKNFCKKLFIYYPAIFERDVNDWIKQSGETAESLGIYSVPLSIPWVINDSEWLKQLVARGLRVDEKFGYRYWNDLHVVSISYE